MTSSNGTFWSGESLTERLPELIEPFEAAHVDCSSYALALGEEVYVSPSEESVDPNSVTIRRLAAGESVAIPPGQMAFLLTKEVVRVPSSAMAFISIRARVKFRGLVNISGFHVDPGYRGRLIFSVFNAGPASIHMKRGQRLFLIWYASLDRDSGMTKSEAGHVGMDSNLVAGVAGEIQSLAGVAKKTENVRTEMQERVHKLEREQTITRTLLVYIVVPFLLVIAGQWVLDRIDGGEVVSRESGSIAEQKTGIRGQSKGLQ